MRKKKVVIIIAMLLINTSTTIFVNADWSPGDDYKMHYPQLPDPTGWDVDATYVEGVFPLNVLADDWLCTETGLVSEIHFWGSWLDDDIGNIIAFSIAILEDIPSNPPMIPYSRPGEILWEQIFYSGNWTEAGPWEGVQGWYDPGEGFFLPNNHFQYYQYNFDEIDDPFLQVDGTIYWLSIYAIVEQESPQPRWGWKSSDYHWNDDSVHGFWDKYDWIELTEPPSFDISLDLSFVISGGVPSTNLPPNTPSKPVGDSSGTVGEWIPYTTTTTDPNGDDIRYALDVNYDGIVDFWSSQYHPSGSPYTLRIKFGTPGTYYIRFKAKDIYGAQSGWSPPKQVTITGANDPPTIPATPLGPSSGYVNTNYIFQTNATDPDGDDIEYGWDLDGDDVVDHWTSAFLSGEICTISYAWLLPGTYNIKVKARDSYNATSNWSMVKTITISANRPPEKPDAPSGAISGKLWYTYYYSTSTIDSDGDQVYYWFDWGDGMNTGWLGPYNSGQIATASHSWTAPGTYNLRVKAKDTDGIVSPWSDSTPVMMPKYKDFNQYIFKFFENHPYLCSLLQILIEK